MPFLSNGERQWRLNMNLAFRIASSVSQNQLLRQRNYVSGVSRFLISARQSPPFVADAGLQFSSQAYLLRHSIGPRHLFFLDCPAQSGVGSRELLLGLVTQVCAPAPRTSRHLQPFPSARRLVADRAPLTPANFRSSLAGLPPPLRPRRLPAKGIKTLSVSPPDRV